jgi:hypothetical protein
VHAGAMGTHVRRSGVDGREKWRAREKRSAGGQWLDFKRSGGEGGLEGGRRMEAERKRKREGERGGPGRGSGGRRGRCDAVDVANRWAGPRRGPIASGWVRRGEAVGAALTGGVGSTVRPIRFSNRIKLISNGFKFAPNFDRSKWCLPVLQKF